jgi:hypothetical protein
VIDSCLSKPPWLRSGGMRFWKLEFRILEDICILCLISISTLVTWDESHHIYLLIASARTAYRRLPPSYSSSP